MGLWFLKPICFLAASIALWPAFKPAGATHTAPDICREREQDNIALVWTLQH
jgi:hypothetical protein